MEDILDQTQAINPLGRLLVDEGHISNDDVPRIEEYAGKKSLDFGEAALALRLIKKPTLERAVAKQFDYPILDRKATGYSKELVAAFDPFSRKGEVIRKLRAKLLTHWHHSKQRTLAVVGPTDKRSVSWVAANLAIACSQLGQKCLLIDANLKNPVLGDWFKASPQDGLSSVLVRLTSFDAVHKHLPAFRDLYLLPAGTLPPNPTEVLARRELHSLVSYVRNKFDVTIVDTSPFMSESGADTVASACGNALLVVERNRTQFADTKQTIQSLSGSGASIVGSVLA